MQNSEMKIYIAGPFFNEEERINISLIENLCEFSKIKYFSPRSEGVLKDMTKEQRRDRMSDIFKSNISNMDSCTHMIAITDNYDTGTIWEMGYFFAKSKPCVTFSPARYPANVMLNESILGHCVNLEDVMSTLINNEKLEKGDDVI